MFSLLRSRANTATNTTTPTKGKAKVIRQGILEKRGKLNTSLKKRWCVLREDGCLYYSKMAEKDRESPIDAISMHQVVVRVSCTDPYAFEVITKDRVYYFVAHSKEERLEWVKTISQLTLLNAENELIEKAEEMITRATYMKSRQEEEIYFSSPFAAT